MDATNVQSLYLIKVQYMATAESKPILIMRKYIRHIVCTFVRYI